MNQATQAHNGGKSPSNNPEKKGKGPVFLLSVNRNNAPQLEGDALIKVVKKHKMTCVFCGFRSKTGMRAQLRPGKDPAKLGSWVCACPICHDALNLNELPDQNAGSIIALPELPQQMLNRYLHASWLLDVLGDPHGLRFQVSEILGRREYNLETELGLDMKDARKFAELLEGLDDEDYKNRGRAISSLRYVPDQRRYEPMIERWADEIYRKIGADSTEALIKSYGLA